MKLSEYARREGIQYRSAWNRFKQGKIPGAYINDFGKIVVPEEQASLDNCAALYARVSTHGQKDDLERQMERLKEFASARGFEITEAIKEVGSGVNDQRPRLRTLLQRPTWGVLIVEHRDRLTRVGFGWFETFMELMGKEIIVIDSTEESQEGRVDDIFSLMYSFAASEYGKRGAKNRAERAKKELINE